jgi:hypothetical protein
MLNLSSIRRRWREGSTISGLMDTIATTVSVSLQHGVPLKVFCEKFAHMRFEPSGWTGNEQIGYAKSLMDYIFRWLELRFLKGEQLSMFNMPATRLPPPPPTLSYLFSVAYLPKAKSTRSFVRNLYVAPFDRLPFCGQSHLKKWEPDAAFCLYPPLHQLQIFKRPCLPPLQLPQVGRRPSQRVLLSPERQNPTVGRGRRGARQA